MVQATSAFLFIKKVAVPKRFMVVAAVMAIHRINPRQAFVRTPPHLFTVGSGLKAEGGVFLVQAVIVAAGKKRADEQFYPIPLVQQPPRKNCCLGLPGHKDFLRQLATLLRSVLPDRPRLS